MATIQDVAARAKVSVGTVSRVLNNSPLLSPRTREKVLDAIRELDYRPSQLARSLSLGRTNTVGVIVPFFTQASVVQRLRGVVDTLRGTGYDLVLFSVDSPAQREEHLRNLVRRDRAEGLLIFSLRPQDRDAERFRSARVPVVLVDAVHPSLPHVIVDDVQGGFLATRHLLDLGHRRIAFVGDPVDNPFGFTSSRDRRDGFLRALAEKGIAPPAAYLKEGAHGRHVAHRLTSELLGLPEPPTAIFAASDTQALGVQEAAQQAGLSVPGDLSIIGFDDIEVAPYVGLTTVRQPLYETGARGAELLLAGLRGQTMEPVREVLPLEVVARKTTAPPRSLF